MRPVSRAQTWCKPAPCVVTRISDEALPPSTGRSCTRQFFSPRRAAASAAQTPARPPPATTRSKDCSTCFITSVPSLARLCYGYNGIGRGEEYALDPSRPRKTKLSPQPSAAGRPQEFFAVMPRLEAGLFSWLQRRYRAAWDSAPYRAEYSMAEAPMVSVMVNSLDTSAPPLPRSRQRRRRGRPAGYQPWGSPSVRP